MKSIKTKITICICLCAILTSLITGITAINVTKTETNSSARHKMEMEAKNKTIELNGWISCVEQSVDTLSDYITKKMDVNAFFRDKAYADNFTKEVESIITDFAMHTDGAISAYIRYNPEYSNPTSGYFLIRNSLEEAFQSIEPTDFSMYEKTDYEHVGWYYIPIENKAPLWMSPYLNENVNIYMISYVVPIYAEDGTSIGIIGMDIDFNQITQIIDSVKIYDTGYAFLTDAQGAITHHKDFEIGTKLEEMDRSLADISEKITDKEDEGTLLKYNYNDKKNQLIYTSLDNQMNFILTAPDKEIYATTNTLMKKVGIGSLIAIIIAAIVGLIISILITKPIIALTEIINKTTQFDFTPTQNGRRLRQYKDEIGQMANKVYEMRQTMRDMINEIGAAQNTILSNVDNLDHIMSDNNIRSQDNSAATEEMAAGIERAAKNTEQIAINVEEVKRNSENIFELTEDGKTKSNQILTRAEEIKNISENSGIQALQMFKEIKEKSDRAIEQSKAVENINALTESIKEISNQTNLLALNANIEAARAGDAGRGFTVVATEIGSLATETFKAVNDINEIVVAVNESVRNMTDCMNTIIKFLDTKVISDYDKFKDSGEQYHEDATAFMDLMAHIKTAIEDLNSYITNIVTSVDEINTTMNQSTEGINIIADKSSKTVESTMEGYERLNASKESVKALEKIIKKFKLK